LAPAVVLDSEMQGKMTPEKLDPRIQEWLDS
jgi:hypothetical protein